MAIKEDIQAIKQELGAEEQFLESMIKGERFFKKYKFVIIGLVAFFLLFVAYYYISTAMEESRLNKTNETYELLLKNPSDTKLLEDLKGNNKPLYEAFLFQQANKTNNIEELKKVLTSSADPLLKDIARFETNSGESQLFENLKILINGYALLKEGKTKEAKNIFNSIPPTSNLQEIVNSLNHYQGENK